jgi:hypothetical protein
MARKMQNCIMSASWPQPHDRSVRHSERPGDIRQRLACVPSRKRLTALMQIQLGRPPHVDASRFSAFTALASPNPDQLPLKFRKAPEDR